jgi:hypothetical protein
MSSATVPLKQAIEQLSSSAKFPDCNSPERERNGEREMAERERGEIGGHAVRDEGVRKGEGERGEACVCRGRGWFS